MDFRERHRNISKMEIRKYNIDFKNQLLKYIYNRIYLLFAISYKITSSIF
jgi:hypothetical protein